jgi:hypothetical protein
MRLAELVDLCNDSVAQLSGRRQFDEAPMDYSEGGTERAPIARTALLPGLKIVLPPRERPSMQPR